MQLLRVQATDFMSYKKLDVTMPQTPGVYLLRGINQEDPSCGSNGAGKSSLMEAITWGLYGTASDLSKASTLLRDGASKYSVILTFDDFEIIRTWSPNSLLLNGQLVSQMEIDQKIGLTFNQYLLTTHIPQNAVHFYDYTPGSKLNFLSEVFDLDSWAELSDRCKDLAQKETTTQTKLGAQTAAAQNKISDLENRIEDAKSKESSWEESRKQRIEGLEVQIVQKNQEAESWEAERVKRKEALEHDLAKAKQELSDWIKERESDIAELESARDSIKVPDQSDLIQERSDLKTAIELSASMKKELYDRRTTLSMTLVRFDVKNLEQSIEALEEKIANSEAKRGTECPTCFQTVTDDHVHGIVEGLKQELLSMRESLVKNKQILQDTNNDLELLKEEFSKADEADQQIQVWSSELKVKEFEIKAEERRIQELNKQIQEARLGLQNNPHKKSLETLEKSLAQVDKEFNPHKESVSFLLDSLAAAEVERCPYSGLPEKLLDELALEREKLNSLGQLIQTSEVLLERHTFWRKEFPKIRLEILREVVDHLDLCVNQALVRVGLSNWSINFSTERMLKNETAKQELTMQILRQGKEGRTKLSGGESQRIKLASMFGIADLVKSRNGVPWSLLMVDEPSKGLSAEGVDDMLETLYLEGEDKVILLAEHKVSNFGRFAGVWDVVKDQSGISSITSNVLVEV